MTAAMVKKYISDHAEKGLFLYKLRCLHCRDQQRCRVADVQVIKCRVCRKVYGSFRSDEIGRHQGALIQSETSRSAPKRPIAA